MKRSEKLLRQILMGHSDGNIPFAGFCHLLKCLGFIERIKGDHHIFTKSGVEEILNVQSKGAKAKLYQVKQVRKVIVNYKLTLEE